MFSWCGRHMERDTIDACVMHIHVTRCTAPHARVGSSTAYNLSFCCRRSGGTNLERGPSMAHECTFYSQIHYTVTAGIWNAQQILLIIGVGTLHKVGGGQILLIIYTKLFCCIYTNSVIS